MPAVSIVPQGQTLVITGVTTEGGSAHTLYTTFTASTGAYSGAVTFPLAVSANTTLYTPAASGALTITATLPDGTPVAPSQVLLQQGTAVWSPQITPQQAALKAGALGAGYLASGAYYFTSSQAASTTSATLGTGTLRVVPWYVPNACTLSRIGGEVSTIGDVGSKFRLGIYADNGLGLPGALVLDAGQIAGDSATVQELTISQVLAPGLYWIGGAVQAVSTTQPTMRVTSGWSPAAAVASPAQPSSAAVVVGSQMTGVTGALPATFASTPAISGSAARVFVKVA